MHLEGTRLNRAMGVGAWGERKRRERKKGQEDQDSSWKPRGAKQLVIKRVEFELYSNHKLDEAKQKFSPLG